MLRPYEEGAAERSQRWGEEELVEWRVG
jgi:hypothetical protein